MLKIYKKTMIYVFCPSSSTTGGPESLHNLVYHLARVGHSVGMVYRPVFRRWAPKAYREYHVRSVDPSKISDRPENIIIVPEIWPAVLDGYKNVQKAIWWLGRGDLRSWAHEFDFSREEDAAVTHLAQSRYVEQYLAGKGALQICPLNSSLNPVFYRRFANARRSGSILYNPVKGFEITRSLIQSAPDLDWRPIQGMTRAQIVRLLRSSKIYVDFGHFPGRERIPREAVLSGCCIFISRRGAASFPQDFPVPIGYSFDVDAGFDPGQVVERIRRCLSNFDEAQREFQYFRNVLLESRNQFALEIKTIFGGGSPARRFLFFLGRGGRHIFSHGLSAAEALRDRLSPEAKKRIKRFLSEVRPRGKDGGA